MRILVVEDEERIRKLLVNVLKKNAEYDVFSAEDGRAALDFLEERNFDWDIVVTDMAMPRMSGQELITELHARAPDIACIVLTAYKNDDYVLGALEQGAFEYVLKPIKVADFQQTVKRAIERRKRFGGAGEQIDLQKDMQGWVELTVPSDYEYIERFRVFTALLGDTPLDPKTRENIRVAVDELGQNAIEWGNRDDRNKQVHLSYCIFNDRVVFKIEDEGGGFDPQKLSDPSVDPLAHIMNRLNQGKRVGGYGVHITRKLMDDVMYNDQGNMVVLTKYFTETDAPAASDETAGEAG